MNPNGKSQLTMKSWKQRWLSHAFFGTICFLIFTSGCKRYRGVIAGSTVLPHSTNMLCYVVQLEAVDMQTNVQKDPAFFVIAWVGGGPVVSGTDGRNRIMSINGKRIAPSYTKRAIYTVDNNGNLHELRLDPMVKLQILTLFAHFNERDLKQSDSVLEMLADAIRTNR